MQLVYHIIVSGIWLKQEDLESVFRDEGFTFMSRMLDWEIAFSEQIINEEKVAAKHDY